MAAEMESQAEAAASPQAPAHILRLPPEIVEQIAEELWHDPEYTCETPERRLGLRLTCRELSAETFRPFANIFFHHVSVIFTRHSLQRLISVGRHPQLSKIPRSLRLGDHMLLEPEEIEHCQGVRRKDNRDLVFQDEKMETAVLDALTPVTRAVQIPSTLEASVILYAAAYLDQEKLWDEKEDVAMLREALTLMPQISEFMIGYSKGIWGSKRLQACASYSSEGDLLDAFHSYPWLDYPPNIDNMNNITIAVSKFMPALADARILSPSLVITSLTIGSENNECGLLYPCEVYLPVYYEGWLRALFGLKKLSLYVVPCESVGGSLINGTCEECFHALSNFLPFGGHLEELQITGHKRDDPRVGFCSVISRTLVGDHRFSCLKKLELSAGVAMPDLIAFLDKQKSGEFALPPLEAMNLVIYGSTGREKLWRLLAEYELLSSLELRIWANVDEDTGLGIGLDFVRAVTRQEVERTVAMRISEGW